MISREPGLLAVVWSGSSPHHPSVSLTGETQEDWERYRYTWSCWRERGWGGGEGAESHDRKKAEYSIKHSMFSVLRPYINFLPFVIPTIWLYPYRYVQSIKYHLTRRTVPVSNCVNTNFDPSRFFNYLSSFLKKVNFFKIQNQPYCVVFLLPLLYFVLWRL